MRDSWRRSAQIGVCAEAIRREPDSERYGGVSWGLWCIYGYIWIKPPLSWRYIPTKTMSLGCVLVKRVTPRPSVRGDREDSLAGEFVSFSGGSALSSSSSSVVSAVVLDRVCALVVNLHRVVRIFPIQYHPW